MLGLWVTIQFIVIHTPSMDNQYHAPCRKMTSCGHQTTIHHVSKETMIQNTTTLMLTYFMVTSCHDDPTNSNIIGVGWIIMVERRNILM
jgi:hypothetical protein